MANHYTNTNYCKITGLEGVFGVTSNHPFNVNETFLIYIVQNKDLNIWQLEYLIDQVAYGSQAVYWLEKKRQLLLLKERRWGWTCILATDKCMINVIFRKFHSCYSWNLYPLIRQFGERDDINFDWQWREKKEGNQPSMFTWPL